MKGLLTIGALLMLLFVTGAQSSGGLDVHLVSQTSSTITLGWTPQTGYGYLFFNRCLADGTNCTLASRTNDPTRSTVKFAKGNETYKVSVIVEGNNGTYPVAPPPPPQPACSDGIDNDGDGKIDYPADPGCSSATDNDETNPPPSTATISQTIINGSTIPNITNWQAVYDANGDGIEDDPGQIQFYIDGVLVLTESNPPFGDTFLGGSPSTTDGQHTFMVKAITDTGTLLVTNTVTATVSSSPPPPPPPSGGYPDASNTGVPAGTSLTVYNGTLTVSTDGAVVDGLDVRGVIVINAYGVTVKNSKAEGIQVWAMDASRPRATIQDTEVDCGGSGTKGFQGTYGDPGGNFNAIRVNVHNCEDGFAVDQNFTVRDSYIHDLATSATAHNDGFQVFGSNSNILLQHNTVYATDTSAIQFCNNTGCVSPVNVLVKDNLLAGGGWTLYCPKVQSFNFVIADNKFSTIIWPKVGYFGSNTDCSGETDGGGNIIYETGAPVDLGT